MSLKFGAYRLDTLSLGLGGDMVKVTVVFGTQFHDLDVDPADGELTRGGADSLISATLRSR